MAAMLSPAQKAMQNLGATEVQEAPAVQAPVNETPAQKALRNLGGKTVEQPKQKFTPLGPPTQAELMQIDAAQMRPIKADMGTRAYTAPAPGGVTVGGMLEQPYRAAQEVGSGIMNTFKESVVNPLSTGLAGYLELVKAGFDEGGVPLPEPVAAPIDDIASRLVATSVQKTPEQVAVEEALAQNPPANTAERITRAVAKPLVDPMTYIGAGGGAQAAKALGVTAKTGIGAAQGAASLGAHTLGQTGDPVAATKAASIGAMAGPFNAIPGLKGAVAEALGMSVAQTGLDLADGTPLPDSPAGWAEYLGPNAAFAAIFRIPGAFSTKLKERGVEPSVADATEKEIAGAFAARQNQAPMAAQLRTPQPSIDYTRGPKQKLPSAITEPQAPGRYYIAGQGMRQSPAFKANGTPVGKPSITEPVVDTPSSKLAAAIDEIIDTKLSKHGIQPTKEVIPSNVKEETVSPKALQAKVLTPEQFEAVEPEPQRVPETEASPATAQPVVEMQREAPVFKFEFQKGKHERILKTQGQEAADAYAQEVGAVSEKTLPLQNETEVQTTPDAEFISTREKYAQIEGETDINKLREFARQNGIEDGPDWNASPDKIAHSMASHLALRDTIASLEARSKPGFKADEGYSANIGYAIDNVVNWSRKQLVQVAQKLGIAVRGTTEFLRNAVRKGLEKLREETGAAGIFDPDEIARRRAEAAARRDDRPIEERDEHAGLGMRDPLTEYLGKIKDKSTRITKQDLIGAGVTEEHLKTVLSPEKLQDLERGVLDAWELSPGNVDRIKLGQRTTPTPEHAALRKRYDEVLREMDIINTRSPRHQDLWRFDDKKAWDKLKEERTELEGKLRIKDEPAYRDYTPPGGTNYREHVITLESADAQTKAEMEAADSHKGIGAPGKLFHMRTTDREVVPDKIYTDSPELSMDDVRARKLKAFNIDEIQSQLHQDGQKFGYKGTSGENFKIDTQPPNAPFKGEQWAELGIRRAIKMALKEGKEYVTWSAGRDIREKVEVIQGSLEEVARKYGVDSETYKQIKGLDRFYDETLKKIVNRIIRGYGGTVETFVDVNSGDIKHGFRIPEKLKHEASTKGMPIRADVLSSLLDKHIQITREAASLLYDGINTITRKYLIPLAKKLGLTIRGTTEKIRSAVKVELHRIATEKSGMALLPTKKYKQPKEFDALPAAIKSRVENSLKTKTPLTVRVAAKRVATALRKEFTTHAPNTEDLANAIEKANYNIGHELNRSFWLSTESRAKSENMLDSMRKKVFGDMKAEDASKLNVFLALNRIVETDNNAIHKGTKHQVGELKPGDAQATLDSLKQNPTTWKLLNDRAQKYYDFNKNEVLPFLEKEGLISSAQRTALEKSGAKYIPLDYVREAPGVHGDETAPFYAEGSSLSVKHSGIKRIDKGSDNALNVDVPTVVSANVHSLVKRAFKNRASVALWKAANDPALAKQFDIENVTAPKGKALPDAPRGYKYVYSMHAGERRATLVPDFIADEWVSGSEYIGGTRMEVISWLSGSKPTKFLTTGGGNPIAFMWLTPMDIMYTRLTAPEYAIPVVGDFRLAGDLAKAFPDAFLPTKFRQRLSEEGGLPNNIHAESQILGDFENNFLNRLNVGFGKLSRLARAKRIVKQTGDYREAAYKVKQQLPFRRGGRSSKWLDATEFPYFNIMVQAASAYGRHIRRNPKSALIAAGSLFAYQTMWSLYNKASFTNDEEVPENVRANNFYFHTGIMVKDAKGREREVLALVRKDQFARSIGAVAEVAADLTVSDLDDASKAKELERLKNGLLQSINLDPSAYMTGPAKAASSYGLNKDLYTRSDVWRGAKVKPSSEVKDDTNPVLVKLAEELSKATGGTKDTPGQVEISPARLGQALKQWIGAGPSGMALDKLTTSMFEEDVPDEVKRDAQEKWWAEIQKHPVLKNSFSLTDPDLPERSKRAVTEMKSNTQNLNLNNELDKLFKNGVLDEQGYAKFTEPLSEEDYRYVEQQVKEREKLSDSPAYWKSLRHLPVDVRITDITSKLERYKKNNPERFKAFKKEIDYNIDDVFDSDNQEVQEKLEVIDNLLRSN